MIEQVPQTVDEAVVLARAALAEIRAAKHEMIGKKVQSTKNLLACRHAGRRSRETRFDVKCQSSPAADNASASRRIDDHLNDLFERERIILDALRNANVHGDF